MNFLIYCPIALFASEEKWPYLKIRDLDRIKTSEGSPWNKYKSSSEKP